MVKPSNHHQSSNSHNNASSLFFSKPHASADDEAAAAGKNNTSNGHDDDEKYDPDFIELVSQLKKAVNKMPLKKQWKRKKAHWSSEKINEWWVHALDCAKETNSKNVQTEKQSSSSSSRQDSHQHLQQQQEQEMIQALSDAVAQLGEDKKKDPKLLRETVREKRIMIRKQYKASMSNTDFKSLWRNVLVKVADIHGIDILKGRRNSSEQQQQQQQGTRKPPPEVANAVAAAAKAAVAVAAAAAGGTDDDDDDDNDALAGPPIKKRKKIVERKQQPQQQPQQQQRQRQPGLLEMDESMTTGDRNKVATYTNTLPTRTVAAFNNSQASSSSNVRRTKVESLDNIHDNQAGMIVIDDDSDDDNADFVQQQHHHHQPEPSEPLTAEQLRFQKMVQEIEDESASDRHVPLQVILKKNRQGWENHLVTQGPIHSRLSKQEFASLWERVEQEACENWQQRIQKSTNAPMDWSFLVFGKHYDAKKATEYFHGWDTVARASP